MRGSKDACQRSLQVFGRLMCLVLLIGALGASCRNAEQSEGGERVQVEVRHIGFDQSSNSPVMILQDHHGTKAIPIWIGVFEAQAIALELQGVSPPRPLIHDLLKNILEKVGVGLEKVVVSELRGNTYYAQIYFVADGQTLQVDSRPSDAVALALRFHRPIFVVKELLDNGTISGGRSEPASTKMFGVTVQNLTVELAAHFELTHPYGVLVADSGVNRGDGHLQRGDIIVAIEGAGVHDVADLHDKLSRVKNRVAALQVRRGAKHVGVILDLKRCYECIE